MKYVALTDDPVERRRAHSNPSDWSQRVFFSEQEAQAWEKEWIAKPGYTGGTGSKGWKYGYTYTITTSTRQ